MKERRDFVGWTVLPYPSDQLSPHHITDACRVLSVVCGAHSTLFYIQVKLTKFPRLYKNTWLGYRGTHSRRLNVMLQTQNRISWVSFFLHLKDISENTDE